MTYRKPSHRSSRRSSGSKFRVAAQVLPIWTTHHSDVSNLVFQAAMTRLGVFDIPSYFAKMRGWIAVCAFLGATFGAAGYGLAGFLIGGLLGVLTPAGAVLLCSALVIWISFMATYLAVWAVIWCVAIWLLH